MITKYKLLPKTVTCSYAIIVRNYTEGKLGPEKIARYHKFYSTPSNILEYKVN